MRGPLRRTQALALLGALGILLPMGVSTSAGVDASTLSTNLLVGDTASLANGIGNWVGTNAAVFHPMSGVLGVRSTSTTTNGWALAVSGSQVAATAAQPDRVYRGSVSVRSAGSSRRVASALQFLGSDGSVLGYVHGDWVTDSTTWQDASPAVGLAPAGTVSVVVGELVSSPLIAEVHYLRSPLLTLSPAGRPSTGVVGPLHVEGSTIYDANGPVVLRGVHRRGLERTGMPGVTDAEAAQAARWGATMMRISLSSAYWLSSNCSYMPGYVDQVDQTVQYVTSHGMVALLDLHTNSTVPCGLVKQQPMADVSALTFWRQVAARYKDNPLVAFDLYNEPHDISDNVWLNGGMAMASGSLFNAAGMQQMYNAVREQGATNLVFVSGNTWANRLPSLIQGTNVVYGVHAYTCPSTKKCYSSTPLDPSTILTNFDWVGQQAPVVVTEFGWPSPDDGQYIRNVVSYVTSHGWDGWTTFAWDGQLGGDFSLLSSLGSSYEPTAAGVSVLDGLNPAP